MDDEHDEAWLESFRYAVGVPVAIVILLVVVLWYLAAVALSWIGEQFTGGPGGRDRTSTDGQASTCPMIARYCCTIASGLHVS